MTIVDLIEATNIQSMTYLEFIMKISPRDIYSQAYYVGTRLQTAVIRLPKYTAGGYILERYKLLDTALVILAI